MDWARKSSLAAHLVVSLVGITIFLATISRSGLWFPDAPAHAMNGVFYKDMLEDAGFLHPRSYAERYFVQYPKLTVAMYPPLFYTVEALFFKVLGISPLVARLVVLLFTLIGVNAFLALCRQWFPLWISLVASTVFLLQPATVFGQTNVMLEMPALAMSMIALYFLYLGLRTDSPLSLFLAPLFCALAFLTKQNVIFLVPFSVIWLVASRKWQILRSAHFIAGVIAGVVLLTPWVVVNVSAGSFYVTAFALQKYHMWSNVLYYVEHFGEIITPAVAVLSCISILLIAKLWFQKGYSFAVLWILCVLGTLSLMEFREPRYAMFLVPPLIIISMNLVCFCLRFIPNVIGHKPVYAVVAVAVVLLHLNPSLLEAGRDIGGFGEVADFVTNDSDCVSVLYDGYFNGNFIFNMRARDLSRRVFVFRASKVVYSTRMIVALGYNELITQYPDFLAMLNRYSVKYVIQEEIDLMNTPSNRRLREWVLQPEFRLVEKYAASTKNLDVIGNFLVYEYMGYEGKPLKKIELDMPILGRRITVDVRGRSE